MDHEEASLARAIAALRTWIPSPGEHVRVESVETALVDGLPGLILRWTQVTTDQGLRCFGLVATAEDVSTLTARTNGEFYLSDLWLLLVEPHSTLADEQTRTWFRSSADFNSQD